MAHVTLGAPPLSPRHLAQNLNREGRQMDRLELLGCELTIETVGILAEKMEQGEFLSLNALYVRESLTSSPEIWTIFCKAIPHLRSLQTLKIEHHSFWEQNADEISSLCTTLRESPLLEHISLRYCQFSPEDLGKVLEAISTRQRCSSLNLSCTFSCWNTTNCEILGKVLSKTRLKELIVHVTWIEPRDLGILLQEANSLEFLDLSFNRLEEEGANEIAKFLAASPCPLRKLDLWNCHLGSEGGKALAKGLARNSSLEELHIGANYLGDEAFATLAKALLHHQCLYYLVAEHNDLKGGEEESYFELVKQNQSLCTLDLSDNDFPLQFKKGIQSNLRHSLSIIL